MPLMFSTSVRAFLCHFCSHADTISHARLCSLLSYVHHWKRTSWNCLLARLITEYWLKKSHGIYRQIMPDVFVALFSIKIPNDSLWGRLDTIFITLADLSVAYTGARSGAIADEPLRSRCRLGSGWNEHKESRIYTVSQKQNKTPNSCP